MRRSIVMVLLALGAAAGFVHGFRSLARGDACHAHAAAPARW